MQSPVWLNDDPSYETASVPSDWEYYSDDYWDEESAKKRKRKGDALEEIAVEGNPIEHGLKRKRRKLKRTENMPEISLGESVVAAPTVVWKSKSDVLQPSDGPVVSEGQGERVSLLKDWRERFKLSSKRERPLSRPSEMQRNGSQKALAVVISRESVKRSYQDTLRPRTLSNSHELPSRSKLARSNTKGTSLATNCMTEATALQEVLPQECVQMQPVDKASRASSSRSRKRKIADSSPTVDHASTATSKTRKIASVGGNIEQTEWQKPGQSPRPTPMTTALAAGKGGLEVSDGAIRGAGPSSRKRKAESEKGLPVESSKSNTWVRKPASDVADGNRKDAGSTQCRRSKREKR